MVINDLDEVTTVSVFKGATKELVKRHVTSIIPLLTASESGQVCDNSGRNEPLEPIKLLKVRPKRKIAKRGEMKTKMLFNSALAWIIINS